MYQRQEIHERTLIVLVVEPIVSSLYCERVEEVHELLRIYHRQNPLRNQFSASWFHSLRCMYENKPGSTGKEFVRTGALRSSSCVSVINLLINIVVEFYSSFHVTKREAFVDACL